MNNEFEINETTVKNILKEDRHDVTVTTDEYGNFIVTFLKTGHAYTVNTAGQIITSNGVEIAKEKPISTDIFVTLYTDGTLGFSNTNEAISDKTVSKEYGNIKDLTYVPGGNIPWYAQRNSINEVTFYNTISPKTTMEWFYNCNNLTKINNTENLNTSNVTNMSAMFSGCSNLASLDVQYFDTSNVTTMHNMFNGCSKLTNLDLSNWNTPKILSRYQMFYNCSKLTNISVNSTWKTILNNIDNTDMFYGCDNTYIDVKETNIGNNTKIEPSDIYVTLYDDGTLGFSNTNENISSKTVSKEYGNIKGLTYTSENVPWYAKRTSIQEVTFYNTIAPTTTFQWFYGCSNLTKINNIENLNTCNVTIMQTMFSGCANLASLDVHNFDTSNVTNMRNIFYDCSKLTNLNLSNWNTSKVVNMFQMFYNCSKLTNISVNSTWKAIIDTNILEGCGTDTFNVKS